MSIVKMRRIRLIGLESDRDALLQGLLLHGCVEVTEPERPPDKLWGALLRTSESNLGQLRADLSKLASALGVLNKYAPVKAGLFSNKELISPDDLFSTDVTEPALEAAERINLLESKITRLFAMCSHLETSRTALEPWSSLDVPLDISGTRQTVVLFGTLSRKTDMDQVEQALYGAAVQSQVFLAESGKEYNHFVLVCHKAQLECAMNVMRGFGYSQVSFSEHKGTALQNIQEIDVKLKESREEIEGCRGQFKALGEGRSRLKLCYDRLAQEIAKAESSEKLMGIGNVFAMEGWLSAPEEDELGKLLASFACAYETAEPEEGDQVPVKLKSNKFTEPLNMVTEMYSLPAYDGIDPNGLIAPFFILFFGIMYADLGYGVILLTLGILAKTRLRLRGTMKHMAGLLVYCGISTAIWGVLFGGIFGDAIPVFSEAFAGKQIQIWSMIDPLQNPMMLMIGAFVLGAVQLLTGMVINGYMCFRDGHPLDAVLDIGSWWLFFAGIAVLVLGHGYWVLLAGVLALICTQGRTSPTLIGKFIGGISSLYGVVDYLSDVLSYIRLMALLLATSVVASVVNILGSMTGSVVGFFVVFLVGHAFNMGINIIGTYVHAARLQYLEFFGKFYKDGGKAFRPLKINTKYHDLYN